MKAGIEDGVVQLEMLVFILGDVRHRLTEGDHDLLRCTTLLEESVQAQSVPKLFFGGSAGTTVDQHGRCCGGKASDNEATLVIVRLGVPAESFGNGLIKFEG